MVSKSELKLLTGLVEQGFTTNDCVIYFLHATLKIKLPRDLDEARSPDPIARYLEWTHTPSFSPKNKEMYYTLLQLEKQHPVLADKIARLFAQGDTDLKGLTTTEAKRLQEWYRMSVDLLSRARYSLGGRQAWSHQQLRVVQQSIFNTCMLILCHSARDLVGGLSYVREPFPEKKQVLFGLPSKENALVKIKDLKWAAFHTILSDTLPLCSQSKPDSRRAAGLTQSDPCLHCLVSLTCGTTSLAPTSSAQVKAKRVWNAWDVPFGIISSYFKTTMQWLPLPGDLSRLCFGYLFGLSLSGSSAYDL